MDVADPQDAVIGFLEQIGGVDFDVLLDLDGRVFSQYDFYTDESYAPYPRQFVIDPDGIIQYRAGQYFPDALMEAIDAELEEIHD